MVVNYVTNAPTSINWMWKIAKNFLEDHTVKKIKINKGVATAEMAAHINPSQLEAKYGGSAPNADVFWPPIVPNGPFAAMNEDPEAYLSAKSSYEEYFPPQEVSYEYSPQEDPSQMEVSYQDDSYIELQVHNEASEEVKLNESEIFEADRYNRKAQQVEFIDSDFFVEIPKKSSKKNRTPTTGSFTPSSIDSFVSKYISADEFTDAFSRNYGLVQSSIFVIDEIEVTRRDSFTQQEAAQSVIEGEFVVEEHLAFDEKPVPADSQEVSYEERSNMLCCSRILNRCSIF